MRSRCATRSTSTCAMPPPRASLDGSCSTGRRRGGAELLERFHGDFEAEGLAARARLTAEAASNGAGPQRTETLTSAFAAWDAGDPDLALERLQSLIHETEDPRRRDLLRRVMVAIFTELGADHPLAREHRRRLAAALS